MGISDMKTPATPLPWCISNPDGDTDTQVIQMREDNPSAVCMGSHEPDAEYIVHACNAYPQLIVELDETLHDLNTWDGTPDALEIIKANIRNTLEKMR